MYIFQQFFIVLKRGDDNKNGTGYGNGTNINLNFDDFMNYFAFFSVYNMISMRINVHCNYDEL